MDNKYELCEAIIVSKIVGNYDIRIETYADVNVKTEKVQFNTCCTVKNNVTNEYVLYVTEGIPHYATTDFGFGIQPYLKDEGNDYKGLSEAIKIIKDIIKKVNRNV